MQTIKSTGYFQILLSILIFSTVFFFTSLTFSSQIMQIRGTPSRRSAEPTVTKFSQSQLKAALKATPKSLLAVKRLIIKPANPHLGDKITISAIIANNGSTPVQGVKVNLSLGKTLIARITHNIGAKGVQEYKGTFSQKDARKAGPYTVKVLVDPNKTLERGFYKCNTKSLRITILPPIMLMQTRAGNIARHINKGQPATKSILAKSVSRTGRVTKKIPANNNLRSRPVGTIRNVTVNLKKHSGRFNKNSPQDLSLDVHWNHRGLLPNRIDFKLYPYRQTQKGVFLQRNVTNNDYCNISVPNSVKAEQKYIVRVQTPDGKVYGDSKPFYPVPEIFYAVLPRHTIKLKTQKITGVTSFHSSAISKTFNVKGAHDKNEKLKKHGNLDNRKLNNGAEDGTGYAGGTGGIGGMKNQPGANMGAIGSGDNKPPFEDDLGDMPDTDLGNVPDRPDDKIPDTDQMTGTVDTISPAANLYGPGGKPLPGLGGIASFVHTKTYRGSASAQAVDNAMDLSGGFPIDPDAKTSTGVDIYRSSNGRSAYVFHYKKGPDILFIEKSPNSNKFITIFIPKNKPEGSKKDLEGSGEKGGKNPLSASMRRKIMDAQAAQALNDILNYVPIQNSGVIDPIRHQTYGPGGQNSKSNNGHAAGHGKAPEIAHQPGSQKPGSQLTGSGRINRNRVNKQVKLPKGYHVIDPAANKSAKSAR